MWWEIWIKQIDRLIYEEIILSLFKIKNFNTFLSKYKRINNDCIDEGDLFNDWVELEREIKDYKEGITNQKIEKNENIQLIFHYFKIFLMM